MIEQSYGQNFFLKSSTSKKKSNLRYVYVRIKVNGLAKETSLKRKWDAERWDQNSEKAIGTKEDAKTMNVFLDSIHSRITLFRNKLINENKPITSEIIIEFINGTDRTKYMLMEEFKLHNKEIDELVKKDKLALGTYDKYEDTYNHTLRYLKKKYKKEDISFKDLGYDFAAGFVHYLMNDRNCQTNTAHKYYANMKKIVLLAVKKGYIEKNPFALYQFRKLKIRKRPLSRHQIRLLENKVFQSDRLSIVRDIFIFQCYTGLAYADVKKLKYNDIVVGMDNSYWIMSKRQKSKSNFDVPLLDEALKIIEKYKKNPICMEKGVVLPVRSNQKMNEYLKEIATLTGINATLNTHMARRTFASTVCLLNGVPIHVVKEMLGHASVQQTEEYSITEQEQINDSMDSLRQKLSPNPSIKPTIESLELRLNELMHFINTKDSTLQDPMQEVIKLAQELNNLKLQLNVH